MTLADQLFSTGGGMLTFTAGIVYLFFEKSISAPSTSSENKSISRDGVSRSIMGAQVCFGLGIYALGSLTVFSGWPDPVGCFGDEIECGVLASKERTSTWQSSCWLDYPE